MGALFTRKKKTNDLLEPSKGDDDFDDSILKSKKHPGGEEKVVDLGEKFAIQNDDDQFLFNYLANQKWKEDQDEMDTDDDNGSTDDEDDKEDQEENEKEEEQ